MGRSKRDKQVAIINGVQICKHSARLVINDATKYIVCGNVLCIFVGVRSVWLKNTCITMNQSCSSAQRGKDFKQVAMWLNEITFYAIILFAQTSLLK